MQLQRSGARIRDVAKTGCTGSDRTARTACPSRSARKRQEDKTGAAHGTGGRAPRNGAFSSVGASGGKRKAGKREFAIVFKNEREPDAGNM